MENYAQKTADYAYHLDRVLASELPPDALAAELALLDSLFVNGRLVVLKEIAAMVWGLPGDPDYGWEDARPDLSQAEKQRLILDMVGVFKAGGDALVPELYHRTPRYIKFRGERIKIKVVHSEAWGYVLFRALEEEAYYLEVLKNVSAVYYNETYRLTTAQGEAFLARPSYEAALGNPGEPEG
jgi:hypothetical protein